MGYVLAMYDIRGKQEFIFRTNKLKEIAGGSWIIRDVFKDYLFPAAEKVGGGKCHGIFYYKNANDREKEDAEFSGEKFEKHLDKEDAGFSKEKFEKHLDEGYIGEVVYDGGGNFLLLYKNEEIFREVTYEFTKSLMESIGSLRVLGTCVKIENFNDYKADRKRLYAAHRVHEMEESIISPWSCLPIVQVDRATSQPLTAPDTQAEGYNLLKQAERSEKHTKESWAKLMKYRDEMRQIKKKTENGYEKSGSSADWQLSQNENVFDELVPEKGVDSQLAVIYIDGNSMGAKVQDCLKDPAGNDLKDYESCVKKLRELSDKIQETYVDNGIEAAMEGQEKGREHRIVVYAGDEVNFIVPAKDAYECAKDYLTSLKKDNTSKNDDSACAGIAVFHSHFPYSEAYRIAEECCESGKKLMKERELKDACLIDFHIIQGAAGVSLDQIREQENGEILSRPWLFSISEEEKEKAERITKTEDVERLAGMFRKLGRGNIKGLSELAKRSSAGLNLDLMRIKSHQPEEARKKMEADWKWLNENEMDDTEKRRLVFDVVQAYDLWFKEEKTGAETHAEGEMSARINAELKIELMSDLCSGSGYSYAGIIDSDICYDTYGIPYIPAKRIKGCLRETLETALYAKYRDRADEVFGWGGSDQISDFVITDAVIEGYDALKAQIARKRMDPDENIRELYGTQNILSRFTHVLAQTKIGKDGAAEDNSLRYTRVVNQFSPLKKVDQFSPLKKEENLAFYAEVSFSDRDDLEELMQDTVRATRHMGLKRNRGFGNVRCSLEKISKSGGPAEKGLPAAGTSDKKVCISYTIRNTAPLMLSGMQEDTSRTYITGQSILGALAGKYQQMQGTDTPDQTFQDLFLKGEAQFANAYPFDDGITYYPAPLYINRLKKTKKYVNVIKRELPEKTELSDSDQDYAPGDGNQPKKLKGKYIFWDEKHVTEHEVEQDIVYHHRHDRKSGEDNEGKIQEGILYSMEVIRPDQCFRGMICLPEKYEPLMKALLQSGDFYFGKSRSAQYGRCVIENIETEAIESAKVSEAEARSPKEFKEGDHLIVTFLSDALFLSERGEYTIYKEEIEKAVQKELGIAVQENPEGGKEKEPYLSSLQTTLATGYLGKWNLRKDAKPAIAAGSYLVYTLAEPFSASKAPCFIGERTLEGYGQIRFDRAEDMDYLMWKEAPAQSGTDYLEGSIDAAGKGDTQAENKDTSMLANLMSDVIIDTWIEQMEYDYLKEPSNAKNSRKNEMMEYGCLKENPGRIQISNTALGRVTLMLKESLEEHKEKPKEAFRDFADRIESIKSNDTGRKAKKILEAAGTTDENGNWELTFSEKVLSPERNRTAAGEPEKLGITEKELKERINQRWGTYLMYILTQQKYEGGGK